MFILLTLLMFLLFIGISYAWREHQPVRKAPEVLAPPPEMVREMGFDLPRGYAFHPGHTWVLDEERESARVGIDAFAGTLFGRIDKIEVIGLNRWIRQGQKLWTITSGNVTADMLSPVEGVVASVNPKVVKDPNLAVTDPYGEGWVCVVRTPEMETNRRNLLRGTWVGPWMKNSIARLATLTPHAAAADGGLPVAGVLQLLDPEAQRSVVHEFFMS